MITRKVVCRICGKEIDDPLTNGNNDNLLNNNTFHFTTKHVKELRLYLLQKSFADIMNKEDDSLYPIYLEFYPDGDVLTALIEIHSLLVDFVKKNIHRLLIV